MIFVKCCIVLVVLSVFVFKYLRQGDGGSNRLFGRKLLESCSMERLQEEIRQEKTRENDSYNDDAGVARQRLISTPGTALWAEVASVGASDEFLNCEVIFNHL